MRPRLSYSSARRLRRGARTNDPPILDVLRLELFSEGLAAQVMYFGPHAAEGPTTARLHQYIHDRGYAFDGLRQKHHEIYLSDPRRTAPEKLKTIIRQPVRQRSWWLLARARCGGWTAPVALCGLGRDGRSSLSSSSRIGESDNGGGERQHHDHQQYYRYRSNIENENVGPEESEHHERQRVPINYE